MITSTEFDLKNAYASEPEGRICGYCNKANDNADDCGYWYVVSEAEPKVSKPACNSCFDIHYPFHVKQYGQGER